MQFTKRRQEVTKRQTRHERERGIGSLREGNSGSGYDQNLLHTITTLSIKICETRGWVE